MILYLAYNTLFVAIGIRTFLEGGFLSKAFMEKTNIPDKSLGWLLGEGEDDGEDGGNAETKEEAAKFWYRWQQYVILERIINQKI